MLEMGVPVRILDLAERMIRLSGCQVGIDIPIEITGVRPGEKLAEVLSTPDEQVLATSHPYINRLLPLQAPPDIFAAELEMLEEATHRRDREAVRALLFCAGTVPGAEIGTDPMVEPAAGPHGEATFDWPELDEAEADLELQDALAAHFSPPDSDTDQVSA